jgi:hypothetical protein
MAPMTNNAADISRRLAERAEAVCRHFLSAGRREGRYWLVGDVRNTPGRSLYVRLTATPDGAGQAGKWTDGATGEHGDLLDIIALAEGHAHLRDTLDAARSFLRMPAMDAGATSPDVRPRPPAPRGSAESARRLFAASKPLRATLAQRYLARRGLPDLKDCGALRFHPRCHYQPSSDDAPGTRTSWPALIAAVTDLQGVVTGVHRTWLDPVSVAKASVAHPRRAMGALLGNGVRFGAPADVIAAGEGIETILSLRQAMPALPAIAALSAAHLAAMLFPPCMRRLYVALDRDPAGDRAVATLSERAGAAAVELRPLRPVHGDFNDDLCRMGIDGLRATLIRQLHDEDRDRFLGPVPG